MRAAEYDAYGPANVLRVREVPPPPSPGPGEALIRVVASAVNPKDSFVRKGRFRALTGEAFPRRVGYDWAGEVVAVGAGVLRVAVGERAYGMLGGWDGGACAEFVLADADELAWMPRALDFAAAAAVPLAALTAWQALREVAGLRAGMRLTVNGASGGVGLFAIQIGVATGARVTAIASAGNEALCRDAGADTFIDYSAAPEAGGGSDVFFDVFGNRRFEDVGPTLAENSVFVSTVPSQAILDHQEATGGDHGRRARLVVVRADAEDLAILASMIDRGLVRPRVDMVYPLDRIADAHRHVETKHTRGKVVVSLAEN